MSESVTLIDRGQKIMGCLESGQIRRVRCADEHCLHKLEIKMKSPSPQCCLLACACLVGMPRPGGRVALFRRDAERFVGRAQSVTGWSGSTGPARVARSSNASRSSRSSICGSRRAPPRIVTAVRLRGVCARQRVQHLDPPGPAWRKPTPGCWTRNRVRLPSGWGLPNWARRPRRRPNGASPVTRFVRRMPKRQAAPGGPARRSRMRELPRRRREMRGAAHAIRLDEEKPRGEAGTRFSRHKGPRERRAARPNAISAPPAATWTTT